MNRICFVSKIEGRSAAPGTEYRECQGMFNTPVKSLPVAISRTFLKPVPLFFVTNMHLFCWIGTWFLFTCYSVLITNLDLLKLCGDGNPEMLQFLNIWVICALKLFYVYQTKSLLLYSIEWLSWIANCTLSHVLVISESSHRVLFVSQRWFAALVILLWRYMQGPISAEWVQYLTSLFNI